MLVIIRKMTRSSTCDGAALVDCGPCREFFQSFRSRSPQWSVETNSKVMSRGRTKSTPASLPLSVASHRRPE